MHELLHVIEHILGSCGDQHPTLMGFLLEPQSFNTIINYIKTWRKL